MRTIFYLLMLLAFASFMMGLLADNRSDDAGALRANELQTGSIGTNSPVSHAKADNGDRLRMVPADLVLAALPEADMAAKCGTWTVRQGVSAIDDSLNVVAQVPSTDLVPSKQGVPTRLKLAIRCLEGKTAFAVHFGDHFMASSKYGDWGHVTYRIDHNAAVNDGWIHSSDNEELSVEGPGPFAWRCSW
jgi:hypothetical protein